MHRMKRPLTSVVTIRHRPISPKEGTGTLTITGNDNFLSGALRILDGRVHVMNDRSAAESGGLRFTHHSPPNSRFTICKAAA